MTVESGLASDAMQAALEPLASPRSARAALALQALAANPAVVGVARDARGLTVYWSGSRQADAYAEALEVMGPLGATVKPVGPIVAHGFDARERPVRPGASIGAVDSVPGTLTACVRPRRGADRARYILSCEHVLRGLNRPIAQPAANDTYARGRYDIVATVSRSAGLRADSVNDMDAAIARLEPRVAAQNIVLGLERCILATGGELLDRAPVTMVGRTSGVSHGKVLRQDDHVVRVAYDDLPGAPTYVLRNVVEATYGSAPGDSGAPVLDAVTGALVGMHVAGHAGAGHSYFVSITPVLARLEVDLI